LASLAKTSLQKNPLLLLQAKDDTIHREVNVCFVADYWLLKQVVAAVIVRLIKQNITRVVFL